MTDFDHSDLCAVPLQPTTSPSELLNPPGFHPSPTQPLALPFPSA